MDRLIEQAKQFPYHSFLYDLPQVATEVVEGADYLIVAEPAVSLIPNRYKAYWAARSVDALIEGCRAVTELLKARSPQGDILIEHVLEEFIPALEESGKRVVSEWTDFWIKDLQALTLEPTSCKATIRPMRPEEFSAVAEITRACRLVSREFYGETDEAVQEWWDDEDTEIFVAELDGKVVGTCFMAEYGYDHPKGSVAWLRELAVHPTYQHQHIGRALAVTGLNWGIKRGAKRSFLAVDVQNYNAIQLYEHLGYRRAEGRGQINLSWGIE